MIRYYIFALGWLWKHRYWHDSRQKWKAFDRDCRVRLGGRF